MSYKIVYDKPALKFIKKQPPTQQRRIVEAVHRLPFEGDVKPMAGQPGYFRLRVGSYRVIYTVYEEIITVRITAAGNRGDVYK